MNSPTGENENVMDVVSIMTTEAHGRLHIKGLTCFADPHKLGHRSRCLFDAQYKQTVILPTAKCTSRSSGNSRVVLKCI